LFAYGAFVRTYVAEVAPETGTQELPSGLFCHWYVKVPLPVAVTEKETGLPAITLESLGFETTGGVQTVKVAGVDATTEQEFPVT
jgi:hypothetical protein